MKQLFGLTLAIATVASVAAIAATPERVRGTVQSVSADSLTVHSGGKDVMVALAPTTHYLKVVASSLSKVDKDSFIGTATKEVGGKMIALEVVIFPPAMKGAGEGHYGWDRIHDTTLNGGGTTSSTMTNGTVSTVQSSGATANSTMTNGTVSSSSSQGGAKQITLTYKGGEQTILVPPTAPIVTFEPTTKSEVATGKVVFVNARDDGGKLTANSVAVGTPGAPPPM